jgi:CubicO group peptidase (beta-lactamase class C family)
MDPALVKEAVAFAMANESKNPRDLALNHALAQAGEPYNDPVGPFKERGPQTGVIVRHGYLVADWGEPQRVDMTYSVTKSFVSSVVGLAYDRGLIRDLNDKVKDYVPTEHFASAHNQKITWDHLLRQTSDWEGTLWGKPDWADRPPEDRKTWSAWIGRARNEPGSVLEVQRRAREPARVRRAAGVASAAAAGAARARDGADRRLEHLALARLRQLLGRAGRPEGPVGQRRRALGRRDVDQRPRPGRASACSRCAAAAGRTSRSCRRSGSRWPRRRPRPTPGMAS